MFCIINHTNDVKTILTPFMGEFQREIWYLYTTLLYDKMSLTKQNACLLCLWKDVYELI